MTRARKECLSESQLTMLRDVSWATRHFDGMAARTAASLRRLRALEASGLVEAIGLVTVCDGDGYSIQPEREREGFRITKAGEALVATPKRKAGR